MCSFEVFVYLHSYILVLSVRLSGTVGFFFLLFLLVFILYLYLHFVFFVLPEWRNKDLIVTNCALKPVFVLDRFYVVSVANVLES